MIIGVKKRFVFVANSKCASTSIEGALVDHAEIERGKTPQRKHITLQDALREYDFLFRQPDMRPETFLKFGVMRDPIDWIQSWYRYRKGNDVAAPIPAEMSFEEFWEKKDWNIAHPNGRKNLQSRYFKASDGVLLADYIIPYEDIATHFVKITGLLNIKAALPVRNVSRLRNIGSDLPASLIAEMREFYHEDYALLHRMPEIIAVYLQSRTQTGGTPGVAC